MAQTLAPITLFVLRHLRTHGITPLNALKAARSELKAKTLANLAGSGHVARHDAGYSITPKGRAKLKATEHQGAADAAAADEEETPESHTMVAAAGLPVAAPAPALPMLSNAEAEASITAVLKRARVRPSLQDIARRAHLAEHIVRPTLTTMIQQGKVDGTSTKPALYRLVQLRAALAPVHMGRGPSDYPTGYSCPELSRNPGIGADRFEAFKLPSRMGDRLHWPDGRTTHVNDPR